ncbi:hypothetical protein F4780DRAFT_686761 [Xylariomycetidae sp. FL0641]|nr:hypothetical protein F4780DRAFT_686761 [Xylariomycetidae sp. FL0641]
MALEDVLRDRALQSGSRQASVFAVAITFVLIAFFIIAVRIHVRYAITKSVGWDDVCMVIGTLLAFGLSAASMAAAWYGVGLHVNQIPLDDMKPMLQAIYSTRLLYVVAMFFVKMALLIFYLRLDTRTNMKYIVYFQMFVLIGFQIASFFILAFSCYPPKMFWDIDGTVQGHCMSPQSQQSFYDANGVINIVIDLAIYITPMPMLWTIKVSLRQKIALTCIFGTGIVAVAAGCVRFAYVRLLAHTSDMYFFLADSLSWCEIELYLAIYCGSASTLRVLLRTYFPGILGSSVKKSYDPQTYSASGPRRAYQDLGRQKSGKAIISGGTTDPRSDSEELIIQTEASGNITVRREFRLETLRREADEPDLEQEPAGALSAMPRSHYRSRPDTTDYTRN